VVAAGRDWFDVRDSRAAVGCHGLYSGVVVALCKENPFSVGKGYEDFFFPPSPFLLTLFGIFLSGLSGTAASSALSCTQEGNP
jgi:hypothetical protein